MYYSDNIPAADDASFFHISLAEWSFHKALFAGEMDHLDFPIIAQKHFGIAVVEYVNLFFKDRAGDHDYLAQLRQRCGDHGVISHLIMVDEEGPLADTDDTRRMRAVDNHYKWVDAAASLGCRSIRVNAFSEGGNAADVQTAAVDGISRLAEYAEKAGINILLENHGGYTSDGIWMATLMKRIGKATVGTLPDFGNFCLRREGGHVWDGKCLEEYDRYKGVEEMMPYAKAVSAKANDFDAEGNCVETDYYRMLRIVKDAGFSGYIGIEYSNETKNEEEGVRKTLALLRKTAARLDKKGIEETF